MSDVKFIRKNGHVIPIKGSGGNAGKAVGHHHVGAGERFGNGAIAGAKIGGAIGAALGGTGGAILGGAAHGIPGAAHGIPGAFGGAVAGAIAGSVNTALNGAVIGGVGNAAFGSRTRK